MDEKRVLCEFKLDKSITLGFQNVRYTFKTKKAFELCFNIGQLCTDQYTAAYTDVHTDVLSTDTCTRSLALEKVAVHKRALLFCYSKLNHFYTLYPEARTT